MSRGRSGFTIVELLVVSVLGSLLLMAIYQVLVTNQRTYREQADRVRQQQLMRMASDVITNELREVSLAGGDLLGGGNIFVAFRTPDEMGFACSTLDGTGSPPVLQVLKVEDWFESGDSVFVLSDHNEGMSSDDVWVGAQVTAIDTTNVTCSGRPAQALTFTGQAALFQVDTVRSGAPVRSFHRLEFRRAAISGGYWLSRSVDGGALTPLVGPFSSLWFRFYNADGSSVNPAGSNVAQLGVSLGLGSDTTVVTVFPRN